MDADAEVADTPSGWGNGDDADDRAEAGTHLPGLPLPLDTEPMEARSAEALPKGEGWQFEPKWDGFRCLAFRSGAVVDLRAKSGKPLGRYFPEVVQRLIGVAPDRFVLDGELVIPQDGSLSFDALQMRLHPAATRIARLSRETPAVLVLFDMLVDVDGSDLTGLPLAARRPRLEAFWKGIGSPGGFRLSPFTTDAAQAEAWIAQAGAALDGVVAKPVAEPYRRGERSMIKVKRLRTADCVVGGFRYAQNAEVVGSLLLGLYNAAGQLDHVGFTSSFAGIDKAALTRQLQGLEGEGFTGRSPGGPSRWKPEGGTAFVPLRHELVAEVRYDHASGDRFRHGTRFLRWRPDKAPRQCGSEQIDHPLDPQGVAEVLAGARHER